MGTDPSLFLGATTAVLAALFLLVAAGLVAAWRERQLLVRTIEERDLALKLAQQREDALDASRKQLLRLTAHDLYSPLTLAAFGGTLIEDRSPDPAVRALAGDVVASIQKMRRCISAEVRLPVEPLEGVDTEPVDLDEVVRDIARAMEGRLAQLDQRIELHLAPVDALGSPKVLQSVVATLLHHASERGPEGTTITVQSWQDDEHAWLRVRDMGHHFPPELHQAVFGGITSGAFLPESAHASALRLTRLALRAIGGDMAVEDVSPGTSLLVHLHRGGEPTVVAADPERTVLLP